MSLQPNAEWAIIYHQVRGRMERNVHFYLGTCSSGYFIGLKIHVIYEVYYPSLNCLLSVVTTKLILFHRVSLVLNGRDDFARHKQHCSNDYQLRTLAVGKSILLVILYFDHN